MSIDRQLGMASAHMQRGELGAAEKILTQILDHEPGNPHVLNSLGIIAVQTGRAELALARFEQAVHMAPGDAPGHVNLGKTLLGAGRPRAAVEALERAVALDPGRALAHLSLANAQMRLGRFDAAIEGFQEAIRLRPALASAHCNLGAVYKEIGRLDDAVTCFNAAIGARADFSEAYSNLGLVLMELGRIDEALGACAKAVEITPGAVQAQLNLGVVRKEAGDVAGALAAYDAAAARAPESPEVQVNRGNALKSSGSLGQAIDAFQRAVALDPHLAQAWSNMAAVHLLAGHPDEALGVCRHYLDEHPRDARVLAAMVVALGEAGRTGEVAQWLDFERLIRAVRIVPPHGHGDIDSFNRALARHVLGHRSLTVSPASHATRHGEHTGELFAEPLGPMADFHAVLRAAVAEHMAIVCNAAPDAYFTPAPAKIRETAWAVVMHAQGHQIAHIHPTAWLSGVYYAKVPDLVAQSDAHHAGWIEFGDPGDDFHFSVAPPARLYQPRPGLMLLFPSYMYHRTIPFDADETRISIAFDIIVDN